MRGIDPGREGQAKRFWFGLRIMGMVFTFRVFRAAVFAEPTIPDVEEVVGLIHYFSIHENTRKVTQERTVSCEFVELMRGFTAGARNAETLKHQSA
jgi:hypothetical protein